MANYLQGPAYNTYQTESYKLPAQQIVQAIATRNAYWDAGASQLKNAYQNYLGLDLSLKTNQDKLDGLMQGVNSNLKNVVATDLSLADNVNTAMKIFDPITKDDDIKYDNAVTKFYKSEIQKAQSLKSVNGGKDYNDANFQDMVKPLQDFIKSDDPSKARDVYTNRRYYTPYYDVMEEYNKVEKNFKPDITSFTRPETDANGKLTNSGRMIEEKNKSIYASQLRAYMSAHLSDKAKDQLRLNGRVSYGDNVDILAGDYINYNNDKIQSYNSEINILKGKKKAAIASGRTTDAEVYQHDINQYSGELKKLITSNTKLKIGDYSDLLKEKDNIAGQVYSSNWIDNIAKSSERKDIEIKYSSDDAALFFLKMNNDNANKNADRTLDWEMNQANINSREKVATISAASKAKKVDENGVEILDTDPTYATAGESNNENSGKAEIDKMQADGEALKTDAADALNKYLTSAGIIDPTKSKEINDAATEEWKKNNPNDYRWKDYTEQVNLANSKIASAKAVQDFVDAELKKTNPEYFNKNRLKNISMPIGFGDLTVDDINNAFLGNGSDKIKIKDLYPGKSAASTLVGKRRYEISINGKIIGDKISVLGPTDDKDNTRYQQILRVIGAIKETDTEVIEKRNSLYKQAITRIEGLERFKQQPGQKDGESPILDNVRTVVMNKLGASGVKPTDVFITHRNKSGGIYFKVDETSDKVDGGKIKKIVEQVGGKYRKDFEGGSYYLPNSEVGAFIKPKIFSDNRLEPIQVEVDFTIANKKNNEIFKTSGIKFNDRNFYFRVTNRSGIPFYEVIDEDSQASFINFATGQPFSSLEEASSIASMLSKLKPEDLETKIRTLGNKPNYKINPTK